jgi:hypothetical protein
MKATGVRAGVWLSCFLLIAAGGEAFEWFEHRELSNAALLVGGHGAVRAAMSPAMVRAVEARSASAVTFGDVTVAVDWFQNPEKLLDPATVATNIRRRRLSLVKRGLAAHHNADHFQAAALSEWQKYHARAVRNAADDPAAALLAEAVALHFLQDFFAAGHVVTPRRGMHDAAAANLHDHFNSRGVAFALAAEQPPEVASILRDLVEGKCLTPGERKAYEAATARTSVRFYGDANLSASQEQKAFLMVVSALSVTEVLMGSTHTPVGPLQTCFSTRQIVDAKKVPMEIEGPDGGIRLAEMSAPAVVGDCSERTPWLGRYGTRHDAALGKLDYDLAGLNVRSALGTGRRSRDTRVDVEVLFLANSEDPPGALVVRDTGKKYTGSNGMLLTTGPTYSHGTRYNAWGWLVDETFTTGTDLISWGVRGSLRRYGWGAEHPWRADYGVKIGVGFQVVNVVFAVDRQHTVDSAGKFAHDYFGSIGADAAFSATWLRFLRHKRQ